MRILYIAPRYYPYIGGVEYVVKSLATRLARMGHQVTVLCGESGIDRPKEEEVEGVYVIRWPTIAPNSAYHVPRLKTKFNELLAELAKAHDVAHAHSAHAALPVQAGLKLKQYNPGIRLVFTLHYHGTGHTIARKLLWNLFWRNRVGQLVKKADRIHAVSHYEAQLIQKHYPQTRNKIVVIPNGVDEDVLNYKWRGENSNYMIYAGRIEKYKRLELAVDLAKKIGLKLVTLGDGSHKKKIIRYAEKHYPGKVEFYPPQPRHRYLELLANARYAVNPSKHEAYSIFTAEALTIGTPCIASATIAKTLITKVQKLPYIKDAMLLHKARIASWNEVLSKLIRLYINLI